MKRVILLALFVMLSTTAFAQSPSPTPSISPAVSPTINQAGSPLPASTATPARTAGERPDLPFWVEMFASGVMLVSVISIFLLVWRHQADKGQTISPRHIQYVSVCLIVPTILILGLEKVLTSETSATLIGGLAGYLLSGIGKHDPEKNGGDGGGTAPQPASPNGGQVPKDKVEQSPKEQVANGRAINGSSRLSPP